MLDTPEASLLGELAGASPTERLDEGRLDRESIYLLILKNNFPHTDPFPPAPLLP